MRICICASASTILADEPVESIDGAFGFAQIGAAHAFSLKVIQHGRHRSERGKGAPKRTDTSRPQE
jgi:hypothetical protein